MVFMTTDKVEYQDNSLGVVMHPVVKSVLEILHLKSLHFLISYHPSPLMLWSTLGTRVSIMLILAYTLNYPICLLKKILCLQVNNHYWCQPLETVSRSDLPMFL